MSEKNNYYQLLGVNPTDDRKVIKVAYKIKTKEYHPDLNPDNKVFAEKKMKQLTEAYDIVMDPAKRSEYDNQHCYRIRIPLQLRRSGHLDHFSRDITTPKPGIFDRIKSFFRGKNCHEEKVELPRDLADKFSMGVTYATKKDKSMLKMAQAEFQSVIKKLPDYKDAIYNIAIIQYRMGKFDEALDLFRKLHIQYPEDQDIIRMTTLLNDKLIK
ncbi:MAG: DnaJ domain-containing protein [Candidatus Eremiobacteraeota bacterium]|nr:DnaJ domain-containing protein [Candidatus Eremiobacteraeota bacterium]